MNWGGLSVAVGLAAATYLMGPWFFAAFLAFCVWLLWVS
mgnify:CR=1 FL=1